MLKSARHNLYKILESFDAKKSIADKGIKAMYEVLKLGRLHNLTIPCQLDLFDKMVWM
jgi:hypothetical protein